MANLKSICHQPNPASCRVRVLSSFKLVSSFSYWYHSPLFFSQINPNKIITHTNLLFLFPFFNPIHPPFSLSKLTMSKATKRKAKQNEESKQRNKRSTKIKPPKQDEYFEDKRNLVKLQPSFSILICFCIN